MSKARSQPTSFLPRISDLYDHLDFEEEVFLLEEAVFLEEEEVLQQDFAALEP